MDTENQNNPVTQPPQLNNADNPSLATNSEFNSGTETYVTAPTYYLGQVLEAKATIYTLIPYIIGILVYVVITLGVVYGVVAAFPFSLSGNGSDKLLAFGGLSLALLFSFWQAFTLSRFPLKTCITGDSLTTTSLRGKKTIHLNNLRELSTAILVSGKMGSTYCLKCVDASGVTTFLQLGGLSRADRTLLAAPLMHGFKTSSPATTEDATDLWEKWYAYPGAPSYPALPVTSQAKRDYTWLIIIPAVLFLFLLGGSHYSHRNSHQVSASNVAAASGVANSYIIDLSSANTSGMSKLESPKLQVDPQHVEFLRSLQPFDQAPIEFVAQSAGTDTKGDYVSYVYRYNEGAKTYYIKLALGQYDGQWRVWFFQTSYSVLKA